MPASLNNRCIPTGLYRVCRPQRLGHYVGVPLLGLLAAIDAPALAQQRAVLEEVTVTAQRREQNLQTVPISVVVETGASLQKKGVVDLSGLAQRTPNLYLDDGGGVPNIAMRGLSSPGIESIEPSVGFYIDNISLARPRGVTQNPLYDIDRVEVLRGPQGTLWGRNTIAGAINIITAKPTREFEGYIRLESGNYNAHTAEAAFSGPLLPTLFGRLSVYNARRGAYIDNELGGPDGGGLDSEAYRAQLRWEPSERLAFGFKYDHVNHAQLGHAYEIGGAGPAQWAFNTAASGSPPSYLLVPNPITPQLAARGEDFKADLNQHILASGDLWQFINNNPRQSNSTDLITFNASYELADGYSFSYQTGYIDIETDRLLEFTGAPIDIIGTRNRDNGVEFLSHELRLQSPTEGRFSFVAGVYIDNLKVDQNPWTEGGGALINAFGTELLSQDGDTEEVDSWSTYFEGTYRFNARWSATLGARYGEEEKTWEDRIGLELLNGSQRTGVYLVGADVLLDPVTGLPASDRVTQTLKRDDDYITWSAKLQYFPQDAVMLYATVATGFKSGGFNNGGDTLILAEKVVDEETSISFEIGAKTTFADGRGRFNATLFRTNFDDLQVSRNNEQGVVVTTNAAKAHTQGVELEGSWQLAQQWTVGGSYSFLDAKYDKFENAPCGPFALIRDISAGRIADGCPLQGQDLSDQALTRAPRHSASLYIEYFGPLTERWQLQGYLGYAFRDRAYTQIHNELESDILRLVDARLALIDDYNGWTLALKGNNLTDERAVIHRQDNDLAAGAHFAVVTLPRTYALEVRKTF